MRHIIRLDKERMRSGRMAFEQMEKNKNMREDDERGIVSNTYLIYFTYKF